MEPESSLVDDSGPWADSAQIKLSTFALQLFLSVVVICKILGYTRWRFVLIAIDVLKWCDDKLYEVFFIGNWFRNNERRQEGVAEQGDAEQGGAERPVGSGFAYLLICSFVVFNIILYSCRVFMLVPKIYVELPVSWFCAIGVTILLWPVINSALDGITWICRKMLRRLYKKSDE